MFQIRWAAKWTTAVWALALFALVLFVYLYNYPYRIWGAGGDTTPAELLPLAIERNGSLHFDGLEGVGALPFWFQRVEGRITSSYPIVPGFFNIPAYAIASARGLDLDQRRRSLLSMISASVVTAASAVFFFLFAAAITSRRSTAVVATLVYAFCTTAFSVAARGMWQHGPSLLFLTCALWLLTRTSASSYVVAGFALGFAIFNRPVNLLLVGPLVIWAVSSGHWRRIAALGAGMIVPATLMSWYSLSYWGSVSNLGQYAVRGTGVRLFRPEQMAEGFAGLLVSPSRGLFVFTPLFVFSFVILWKILRRPLTNPLLTALGTGVVLTLALYSAWYSWWGGSCFGYRLLTELVPALVIMLAWGWEHVFTAVHVRAILLVLAAVSFYVHLLGAFLAPCGFDYKPNDINSDPRRLWWVSDNEIVRCSSTFYERLSR